MSYQHKERIRKAEAWDKLKDYIDHKLNLISESYTEFPDIDAPTRLAEGCYENIRTQMDYFVHEGEEDNQ